MRILIVGDDPDTSALLGQVLTGPEWQVIVLPSRNSRWSSLAPSQPDLIILDNPFPGTDGWAVLPQIRRRSAVPIIVLTNVEDSHFTVSSLDLGADYCLTKPFDVGELQARVRALIRRSQCGGLAPQDLIS